MESPGELLKEGDQEVVKTESARRGDCAMSNSLLQHVPSSEFTAVGKQVGHMFGYAIVIF